MPVGTNALFLPDHESRSWIFDRQAAAIESINYSTLLTKYNLFALCYRQYENRINLNSSFPAVLARKEPNLFVIPAVTPLISQSGPQTGNSDIKQTGFG